MKKFGIQNEIVLKMLKQLLLELNVLSHTYRQTFFLFL